MPSRRPTLPALRALITTGAEAWHPIPTRAIRSAAARHGLCVGEGVGRVRVATTGGGAYLVPGAGHRRALPASPSRRPPGPTRVRRRCGRARGTTDKSADTTPPSWPGEEIRVRRPRQQDGLGHARLFFGEPRPAEKKGVRFGLPVPEARAGTRAAGAATQAVAAAARAELLLQMEGPIDAVGGVVAEHVVRARNDAGGAPGAQAGSHDLVVKFGPLQLPALGCLTWFGYGHAA